MEEQNGLRKELEKIKESLENIFKNLEDETKLVSRKELARILNCSKNTVVNYEKEGILKPIKIGKMIRYNIKEALKCAKKH